VAKYLLGLLSFLLCLSTAQNVDSASLLEALEFVTADTSYIYFTDWERLKDYQGVAELSGQDTLGQRTEFYQSLVKDQATASVHGANSAVAYDHTELWGWDTVDLRWELNVTTEGPSVYVLALRKDFELKPLKGLLEAREYAKTSLQGADLYHHELDFEADWVLGELSIFNIAIMPDQKILVLSSSLESVQTVLAAYGRALSANRDLYTRAVKPLGKVASAILTLGTLCSDLSFAALVQPLLERGVSREVIDEMSEGLESSALHPYLAFALGYRYENSQPLGVMVMTYSDAALAQADLELRRMAATEGLSLQTNLPYREAVFELQEAQVEDTSVLLELRPINNQPRRLFDMVYARDGHALAFFPGMTQPAWTPDGKLVMVGSLTRLVKKMVFL
jgi:hypothetical protein